MDFILRSNSSSLSQAGLVDERDKSIIVLSDSSLEPTLKYTSIESPETYNQLINHTSNYFPDHYIEKIEYKDFDHDLVTISNDLDLKKAFIDGIKINGRLQVYITYYKKRGPEYESIKIADSILKESPPDVIRDSYIVPCYRCSGSDEACTKCTGSGVLDAYADPSLKTVRNIIRKEMENYLPKLLTAISEQSSSVQHTGVSCNNCGIYPIIGHRFKCSVCINFDFCSECEKKNYHEHPFIKIRNPELVPKLIFCAIDDTKKKTWRPKNRQCEPQTRLVCRFVRDVIGFEGESHSPAEVFIKSWRLRNDGLTAWPQGCRLVFTNGDFRGDDVLLPCMKPGEEKNISVTCVSPSKPGRYNSYWRAIDPTGNRFGQKLTIQINIAQPVQNSDDLTALREIFNNPELVKLAYTKAGGSIQKATELLLSGNIL
jgi:Ig-like domain from next to BRCA1 gene/Zinc finger, ZZ type/PB1 domain